MAMNKLKAIVFACLLLSISLEVSAQFPAKYWVRFSDKNNSPYSVGIPSAYLSAKSGDRNRLYRFASKSNIY